MTEVLMQILADFLYISISSASEVKSMLYLAHKLGYISDDNKNLLLEQANEISKIIRGLLKSVAKP